MATTLGTFSFYPQLESWSVSAPCCVNGEDHFFAMMSGKNGTLNNVAGIETSVT
jgi:hypothetical protein